MNFSINFEDNEIKIKFDSRSKNNLNFELVNSKNNNQENTPAIQLAQPEKKQLSTRHLASEEYKKKYQENLIPNNYQGKLYLCKCGVKIVNYRTSVMRHFLTKKHKNGLEKLSP